MQIASFGHPNYFFGNERQFNITVTMSADQLLKTAGELPLPEFNQFVASVIRLRAERSAPSLPAREAELLVRINQGIPPGTSQRYDELLAKREAGQLSEVEHEELKGLTLQVEMVEAERVRDLSELARLRRTTLPALMASLGLPAPGYA